MHHITPPSLRSLSIALILGVAAVLLVSRQATAQQPAVTTRQIEVAIEKARNYLVGQQRGDGSWECSMRPNETRVGATSLVTLALLNAGLPP